MSSTVVSTPCGAVGVVLEVAEHLGEVLRPVLSCAWSAIGTPSISAVTIAGSGLARSAMISTEPAADDAVDQPLGDLRDVPAQHARRAAA